MSEAIFVLGMHRSGTSFVAGLLKIMGVDFGPDRDLMPPSQYNQKGFFEHIVLNGVNVELMNKFGGEWYAPPEFPPGWEDSVALDTIRKRAQGTIEESFGNSKLWGFKDPRTCVTMPFWRKVVQCPIRVVVVARNPIDSARSVERMQRILASEASNLWLRHMVGAFLGSRGLPRHVVFYEDLMGDFDNEMHRLALFVKTPLSPDLLAQAKVFPDEGLWNFRSSTDDVIAGIGVSPKARKAYLTIRSFVDVAKSGDLEPEDESHIEQILAGI